VRKWPADIGGDDAEKRFRRGREEANVEVAVKEERRDVGAVEDVLEVVGRTPLLLQRLLELAIEGGELLIERLQFLLRGDQLLIGRLKFLVDGEGFLIDRLLLFVGRLEIADRVFQLRTGGVELTLELGDPRDIFCRLAGPIALFWPLGFLKEADQQQFLPIAMNGLGRNADRHGVAVVAYLRAGNDGAGALLARPVDRRAELIPQTVARHRHQVATRLPGNQPQIAIRCSQVIEAFVAPVDQHRSRRIGLNHLPLGDLAKSQALRCPLLQSRQPERPPRRGDREIDLAGPDAADMPINTLRLGDRLEPIVEPAHRLGPAEKEDAAFAQREMKQQEHLFLRLGAQVDEEIAAADQVKTREWRISHYVLDGEDSDFA